MTGAVEMVFEPFPGGDLARHMTDNIYSLAFARTGITEFFPMGFFLRSPRGEWLGGCTGDIWGGWLHIRNLWVTQSLRGAGHGTRLMDAAETYAVERGAGSVTLETHSFQAKGFYLKRGYEVFGMLDNYPQGHAKYFMRKALI
jgi:ribosomal protein S18 acetylase RimI-like enzyme